MTQPNDSNFPRPAKPLQATPGHFALIQNHPGLSNWNTSIAPSPPPPPLHAAIRPTFYNSASPSQNVTGSTSYDAASSSPHSDGLQRPTLTATSLLHPAIKQTYAASTNENFLTRINSFPPAASPSLQPPIWHEAYSSSYRNTPLTPANRSPFDNSQSLGQRRIEFETSSAQQRNLGRPRGRPRKSAASGEPGTIQSQAPAEAISSQPWVESAASIALKRSQAQALAEEQALVKQLNSQSPADVEASNPQQRSPSPTISEADGLMKDGLEDVSSDDEDYLEFKAGLTKARDDREFFKASQDPQQQELSNRNTGTLRLSGRGRRNDIVTRGGYKGVRGHRMAAEPTGDIKARLSKAAEAFLAMDYQEAKAITTEIIRINAETHQAWTMLATCFYELGNRDKALTALTYAAHLEPKNVEGWMHCAEVFLEETGTGLRRDKALQSAFFCYAAALKVDPKNIAAREGKVSVYLERSSYSGAISEYKKILALQPHNLKVIVDLCACYYDNGEFETAKEVYKETFARFRAKPDDFKGILEWSDLNSYMAVYEQLGQPEAAIRELKSLSRWLLCRSSEEFWDNIIKDDREWDSDSSRRFEIADFTADAFPLGTYGDGLPLELRTKLGLFRLELGHNEEAIRHFNWLQGRDDSGEDKVLTYFDLYRPIADRLRDVQLYQDALMFYRPLKQVPEENTGDLYLQMGFCFLGDKLQAEAEECFLAAIRLDENNIEARVQLAKLYETLNEQEQAFFYANEALSLRRILNPDPRQRPRRYRRRRRPTFEGLSVEEVEGVEEAEESKEAEEPRGSKESSEEEEGDFTPVKYLNYHRQRRLADPKKKLEEEMSRADQLKNQYHVFCTKLEEVRRGDTGATREWMTAARDLTDDFRGVRRFFPYDKYAKFLGYRQRGMRRELQEEAAAAGEGELGAMADRLSQHLGAEIADRNQVPMAGMPSDYRDISFNSWLDIFLEFALALARNGRMKESYEICEAAKDCALYYTNREDMFLIHVCWLTCALLLCDEEACVNVARFFMKDYQFTTDSYRMFTAVTRMVHSPVSWYSSGPSQKYILRQIKAMDFSLADEESQKKNFNDKGGYTTVDRDGKVVINDDLDIALLMMYGHILQCGSNYHHALNYFLRALALDPHNSMINLNVGLAYVHQALKRQAENRQHLILQGLTFLFSYYTSRKTSPRIEERQEAHYNMARVYHMLGLPNLAIPYYDLVFKEVEGGGRGREDLVTDAAYNLQSIYAMSGNQELASKITRKWLVV